MKTIIASVLLVALASAEVPSNSYLPPPSSGRFNGYPSGGPTTESFTPEIVAARSLGGPNGANGRGQTNGFGRSGPQDHHNHARNGGDEGYDHNAAAFARNALEELNSEPANYNFGYKVNDYQEGTDFGHHEERQEERAQGEYHVVLPDGRKQTVTYEADERGFKPQISYEESDDLARSGGYDANSNNFNTGYDSNANARSNHGNGYHGNGNHGNGANGRSNGY